VDRSRSEETEYILCTVEAEVKKYSEDVTDTTKQAEDDLMYQNLYSDVVVANKELKEEDGELDIP